MNKFLVILAAFMPLPLTSAATAQDYCGAILSGMYDFRSSSSLDDKQHSFYKWYCRDSNSSSKLRIIAGDTGLDGNINRLEKMCRGESGSESNLSMYREDINAVNSKVVDAWSKCMNQTGLKIGITHSDEAKIFNIYFSYSKVSEYANFAVLKEGEDGFFISGGECKGEWIKGKNRRIYTEMTLTCSRDNLESDVNITINSDVRIVNGSNILRIPAFQKSKESQNQVCIASRSMNRRSIREEGWSCTKEREPSDWLWMNDDTGWKDQSVRLNSFSEEVCFQHQRNGSRGLLDTGWVCAAGGQATPYITIGDDTGYKNQRIRFRWKGTDELCAEYTRYSNSNGLFKNPQVCSSNGMASDWINLGDDTGWKDQKLRLQRK